MKRKRQSIVVATAFAAMIFGCVATSCTRDDSRDSSSHADAVTIAPEDSEPIPGEALGCSQGASPYKPGLSISGSFLAGEGTGGERHYRVFVPTSYRPGEPMPMVMMFHGVVSDPIKIQNKLSFMNDIAEQEGFIVVWPEGWGRIHTWNAGVCCGTAMERDLDDVGFVRSLMDLIDDQVCVDHDRVYAAGMSNGGIFAMRLACEMADSFAAVGVVAGSDSGLECMSSSPVSVMQIHGTDDLIVPYDGGLGCGIFQLDFPSVATTQNRWSERLGCSDTKETWLATTDTECVKRADCPAGVDVGLCTVDAGGHQWPGKGESIYYNDCPEDGDKTETIDASRVLWDFFKEHPKVR